MLRSEDSSNLTRGGSEKFPSINDQRKPFHLDNVNRNAACISITLRNMNIHLVEIM